MYNSTKMNFLILFLFINIVRSKTIVELMQEEWETFKKDFEKIYENEEEEAKRFVVYLQNLQRINDHNKIHGHKYRLGLNKFADMTNEEFNNNKNGYNRTIGLQIHDSNYLPFRRMTLPESVDWRKEGAVTRVKDQGNCGSCWAFSSTGALEGQRHRVFGKLIELSEQNLIDCTRRYGNEGCDGGLMDYAYQYIIDNKGIATEKAYLYQSQTRHCKYNKDERGASITGYIDLPSGNETILQEAVALIGPISVAIDASHLSFQFYESGIYEEPNCNSQVLNHGVLVVGYGREEDQDYWIVKNSWGEDWGINGYILMKRNDNNHCGIATKASYPLI